MERNTGFFEDMSRLTTHFAKGYAGISSIRHHNSGNRSWRLGGQNGGGAKRSERQTYLV